MVVVAAGLSLHVGRMIPGGPFISIHADVIPVVVCTVSFHLAWRSLRASGTRRRIALAFVIIASVAIFILKLEEVVSFWVRPYARGVLIEW